MEGNTLAGPADSRIVQTAHGFEVHPNVVFKHAGDTFTILNNTGSAVHVSFPVLPTDPLQAGILPGKHAVFTILDTTPDVYDYWVQVGVSDDRARKFTLRASGGSDPRIIIDY